MSPDSDATGAADQHDGQSQQDYAAIDALFQDAFAKHRQGLLQEADALYRTLLAQAPDHLDGLHFHGVLLHQRGIHVEALARIEQALSIDPAQVAALANAGLVLRALGRSEAALERYERALALNPEHAECWVNRGNLLSALGRGAQALASYERALALRPDHVDALVHLGNLLREQRRLEEALAAHDRALLLDSAHAGAHAGRGCVLFDLKRYAEAVTSLDRSLELDAGNLAAHSNRGAALVELKQSQEALLSLDRALQIDPDAVTALFNRGIVLRDLKCPAEAAAAFARLLEVSENFPYALGYMLNSKLQYCDWQGYEEAVVRLHDGVLSGKQSDAPYTYLGVSDSALAQLRCAQTWAADLGVFPQPVLSTAHGAHERIRVAYLSADYADHPVPYLIVELFELHDRAKFEVFGISFGPDSQGAMRARLRAAFDQFFDVRGRSDREVAGLLRSLGIDIAIDLMGYTQGNRAGVFAERGAPVQVNYLGYPGTMGMAGFDYILADPWVIPHGHEAAYSESVVRLPDMYQVNDRKRAIDARTPSREEAGLPAKGFVFCCFNNSFKIAPAMFALWMRLLGRVEGSVLWLLEDNAAASRNLRIEAQRHGIGSERIVFAPRRPPPEHLARHRLADLFIDTLPYNAHTTASDALWAGLPLLTCAGTTFAGRVAASLLCAAGLPELVTQDLDAYERTAFALATDPGRLAALRTKLAENRARAPLFDTDRFRRHIEQAYTTMIRRSRDGLSPEPFDVRPVA